MKKNTELNFNEAIVNVSTREKDGKTYKNYCIRKSYKDDNGEYVNVFWRVWLKNPKPFEKDGKYLVQITDGNYSATRDGITLFINSGKIEDFEAKEAKAGF